jgi:hypothetical protein
MAGIAWTTEEEDAALSISRDRSIPWDVIAAKLARMGHPRRTPQALSKKFGALLPRDGKEAWDEVELRVLRLHGARHAAEELGRSLKSCHHRLARLREEDTWQPSK